MHTLADKPPGAPPRTADWAMLAGILLVFALLRVAWINHLVIWDEAMTLCSVRAVYAGGHDDFSNWFWRHPPLFSLLMMLIEPLRDGFQQRSVMLAITVNGLNLALLTVTMWQLAGRRLALWTAFFLAVTPGSVFFDVWIKADHLVTTFGLAAILAMARGKTAVSAACLGLALLSKETAVFYGLGIMLMALIRKASVRELAALVVIPPLMAGWWFLLAASARAGGDGTLHKDLLEHLVFAVNRDAGWELPWHYYVTTLKHCLSVHGIVLAAAGLLPMLGSRPTRAGSVACGACWPLLVLLPSLLLISLLRNKVPWVLIALVPLLAPLQAYGMETLVHWLAACVRPGRFKAVPVYAVCVAVIAGSLYAAAGRDYETVLRLFAEDQWRGASFSREIARTLSTLVAPEDRVLLTSFHYWQGTAPAQACPVFACYFNNRNPVLIRDHGASFSALAADIQTYRIDWAVLSPAPGAEEQELFNGFMGTLGLRPVKTSRAFIFRTSSLHAGP